MVALSQSDNGTKNENPAVDLRKRLGRPRLDDARSGAASTAEVPDETSDQIDELVESMASIEELRLIQRLFFFNGSKGPRTVAFCGVNSDDGAAHMCARTGELLAALIKQPVCLIEDQINLSLFPGRYRADDIANYPARTPDQWKDEIRPVAGHPFLSVLPTEILKSKRPIMLPTEVAHCLAALRKQFDYIVISAPPICQSPETILLGQISDGVVMVIKAHSTPRALAIKAIRQIHEHHARLLGAVLNHDVSGRHDSFDWNSLVGL